MIKVESILKWKVEGPILKKLKMIRSQILSKNSDAVALSDDDLHVTLASGPGWQKLKSKVKASDFDEPDFSIEVEPNFKVMEQGPAQQLFDAPRHEYTRTLMTAAFELRTGGVQQQTKVVIGPILDI